MVHCSELNFDLELSPSVEASSSEESSSETEVSSSSSNSCQTLVTSNRKDSTTTKRRKRANMDDDYNDDEGVSYEQWCSVNIDLLPTEVEVAVPAKGMAPEERVDDESVGEDDSVDMGAFSASSSLASSCDLSPDELARICIMGETGANLTDAQRVKFKESHENTLKYEKSKNDLFRCFLDIIGEKGGKLSRLGTDVVEHEYKQVPALVKALNTAKNRSTRVVILDECLKLFAEFYRRDDGTMYAPGSLKTFYKRLFATLRLDYNVDVKVKYFAKKGSFRSVSTVNMQDARKASKEYGIQKGMSAICINDLEIMFSALKDNVLQPTENAYHLKLVICFILLRLYGLRAQEACNLEVNEVSFEVYDHGPDRGKKFCQLKMDFDKTHKLKFDSSGVPKDYGKLKVRDNPEDDVFNAYYFMKFYCDKVNAGSRTRRFVRRPIGRANFDESVELVWYNSLVVSKEAITNTYRDLEAVIGAPAVEFKDVTAHGGRACLVTYALAHGVTTRAVMQQTRHMNESGLTPYKRVDPCTEAVFQNVLDGVFPKQMQGKEKKACGKMDDEKRNVKSKSEDVTYQDRKPAARSVQKEGSTGGGHLSSNVNSTSESEDVVKQLQQDIAVLKAKMNETVSAEEVQASPAKKAKREEEEDGGKGECGERYARGSMSGVREFRQSESLLMEKMARENEEMRRLLMSRSYESQMRMGYAMQSPFPSSNSDHLQQFMPSDFMSPMGMSAVQQTNLPQGSREDRSGLNSQTNTEQRPEPDTSTASSGGNGGRVEGSRFPSISVPCLIM